MGYRQLSSSAPQACSNTSRRPHHFLTEDDICQSGPLPGRGKRHRIAPRKTYMHAANSSRASEYQKHDAIRQWLEQTASSAWINSHSADHAEDEHTERQRSGPDLVNSSQGPSCQVQVALHPHRHPVTQAPREDPGPLDRGLQLIPRRQSPSSRDSSLISTFDNRTGSPQVNHTLVSCDYTCTSPPKQAAFGSPGAEHQLLLEPIMTAAKCFERRPRHKTKEDKYDFKRKKGKNRREASNDQQLPTQRHRYDHGTEKAKSKNNREASDNLIQQSPISPHRSQRGKKKARVSRMDMLENFRSDNILGHRITVQGVT
jgi:hypothetical protein